MNTYQMFKRSKTDNDHIHVKKKLKQLPSITERLFLTANAMYRVESLTDKEIITSKFKKNKNK